MIADALMNLILDNPGLFMVLGEVGAGKTTLCLSVAQEILRSKKHKVLFIYTRENSAELVNRLIFQPIVDTSSMISIFCSTFDNLLTEILQIETYIANEQRFFKRCQYGMIAIDNLFEYYMLEIGTDTKNTQLNRKMNMILGSLNFIAETYQIPVLLTNIPKSVQKPEQNIEKKYRELDISGYYGGSIVDYWIHNIIKIERTGFHGSRRIKIFKELDNSYQEFIAKLENNGFI